MPRRRRVEKRGIQPDYKYQSPLVTRFVNCVMRRGKKGVAERVFYGAIEEIAKTTEQDGMAIFEKAITNIKPVVEVRARRVGGATYQVPVEVRPERRTALAIRWVIEAAMERPGRSMKEKLAKELVAASNKEGAAFKKREDTHRMAEANRAFAHYRW